MNGAFFQFLGRFQVTIQKYGFSQISETDVVEMKIRFVIFYHYWITLWESRTISLVHFVIGLKPFSRTVYGKSCYWRIVRRSSHWFHFGKSGVFSNHLRRALKKYLFDEIAPKFNENAVLLWVKLSIMKKSLNWMKYMYKFYFI